MFQIAFSRLRSDFCVSYRILASHIVFSRLKSDFHITFPNCIFAPQIGLSSHFQIEFQFVPQIDARRRRHLYRWQAHELADFEDKTATATVNVRGWSAAVMSFELIGVREY